jgi:hypothetical protein
MDDKQNHPFQLPFSGCPWNATERRAFPVLVSLRQGEVALGGAEDASRRKQCNAQDRRMAAGCTLTVTRESEMEIPAEW